MLHSESKMISSYAHQNNVSSCKRTSLTPVSLNKEELRSNRFVKLPSPTVHSIPLSSNTWTFSGSGFSEAETFYLWPKTGGLVLLQLAYSEVVSLFPASQISLRVTTPSLEYFKSTSMSGSAFKSSDQHSSIACAGFTMTKTVTTTAAVEGGTATATTQSPTGPLVIQLDQKTEEYSFSITLTFTQGDWTQVGDGRVGFGPNLDTLHQVYGLKAHVQGSLCVGKHVCELDGEGTMVHQYQSAAPHKIADRWHMINYVSPDISLVTVSGVTPMTMERETFGTLVVRYRDAATNVLRTAVASSSLHVPFLHTQRDKKDGYVLPTQVQVRSELVDDRGSPLTLTLNVTDLPVVPPFRVKILDQLPWLLRKAAQVLFANPVVYQYVSPMQLTLTRPDTGEMVANAAGSGLLEITYMNTV